MTKTKRIHNVPDTKNTEGFWVKSYSTLPYVSHVTRAGTLWASLQVRCKVGGDFQKKKTTYAGVRNGFTDFQEFAEWCQDQYGYLMKQTNGYFWQLDKDLKVIGNKTYTPDTCMFVPSRVNSLLTTCSSARGQWPLGVSYNINKKFTAQYYDNNGRQKYLGSFADPLTAHQTWQRYKISLIRKIAAYDEEIVNHVELQADLLMQALKIETDLLQGIETLQ